MNQTARVELVEFSPRDEGASRRQELKALKCKQKQHVLSTGTSMPGLLHGHITPPAHKAHTHTHRQSNTSSIFFCINVAHNERMLSSSCSWLLSAAMQQLSLRWTLTLTSCPRCQETEIWSLQMFVCVSKAEFRDVSLNQAGPQKNTDNPLVLLLFYLCYHGNHSQQNLRSCCVSEWAPSGFRGYCVPSFISKAVKKTNLSGQQQDFMDPFIRLQPGCSAQL